MFIGTVFLSGGQIGLSVPVHEKTFLLLLFSPIQSLVSSIRSHPFPYILLHDFNQDRQFYCQWITHAESHWCSGKRDSNLDYAPPNNCASLFHFGGDGVKSFQDWFSIMAFVPLWLSIRLMAVASLSNCQSHLSNQKIMKKTQVWKSVFCRDYQSHFWKIFWNERSLMIFFSVV